MKPSPLHPIFRNGTYLTIDIAHLPAMGQQVVDHHSNPHFRFLKQIDFKGASGMIKFLAGSCLSGLGIVLKEPSAI